MQFLFSLISEHSIQLRMRFRKHARSQSVSPSDTSLTGKPRMLNDLQTRGDGPEDMPPARRYHAAKPILLGWAPGGDIMGDSTEKQGQACPHFLAAEHADVTCILTFLKYKFKNVICVTSPALLPGR
jgi:hypothetical protein